MKVAPTTTFTTSYHHHPNTLSHDTTPSSCVYFLTRGLPIIHRDTRTYDRLITTCSRMVVPFRCPPTRNHLQVDFFERLPIRPRGPVSRYNHRWSVTKRPRRLQCAVHPGTFFGCLSPHKSSRTRTGYPLCWKREVQTDNYYRFWCIYLCHLEPPTHGYGYEVTSTRVRFGSPEVCMTSRHTRFRDSTRKTVYFINTSGTPEGIDPMSSRYHSQMVRFG